MKKIRELLFFLLGWCLFQISLGWLGYLDLPPFGMHQGAQADRACIAFNYFSESWNFFLPRVMEDRNANGIVGLEFPIIQYITAIFYKLFGFHNQTYRLVVGIIVFFGHFAAWKIISQFAQNTIHRIAILGLWVLSPLMCFYTFNYLPDLPSMAFSIISYAFFFKFYYEKKSKFYYLFLIFIGLSSLVKITNLIHLIAVVAIMLFKNRFATKKMEYSKTNMWISIIPILFVLTWYKYANYLTHQTNNFHFLQSIHPPSNLAEFFENSRFAINTWIDSLYPRLYLCILLIFYLITIIVSRKKMTLIGILSIITLLGYLSVFTLFNKQFKYHDYYQTLFYSIFLFILIWLYEQTNKFIISTRKTNLKCGLNLGMLILVGFNYSHSKRILSATFDFGNYYCQNAVNVKPSDFELLKSWLDKNIPKNKQLLIGFDPSPNTTLYLLHRKGIRIAPDFSDQLAIDLIKEKLKSNKNVASIFVCNDSNLLNKLPKLKSMLGKPIHRVSAFNIYKIPLFY